MKPFLIIVSTIVSLFLIPNVIIAQAPDLGTTSSFAMFTAVGAFSNDGATQVTGDIGTNVGAFTGFPPGIVIGSIHVADVVTAQAALDVASAYSDLSSLACGQVIGTTLGNGQMLTPDIYCLGAASVLNGDLVLDGQCDPDAFFIFQIDGALSTAVLASVTLINGASLCNVYWQVNGAVSIGEGAVFRGTIIAAGAITLLEGSSLYGRGLTTAGAIEMHDNLVSLEMLPTASELLPDGPTMFCEGDSVILSGNCGGTWNTGESTATITVTTSGEYFVTNSNGCGIIESNHIIITVSPMPICTITGVFTLCESQTTELCATPGYASYLWSTGETVVCITVASSDTYFVTVTDATGCTSVCSQTVSNLDLAPPVITCPTNISIECDADTQPIVTGTASASDDCDSAPAITFSDATIGGPCDQDYTIQRTWIATDDAGNTATCIQSISISDNTAPVITCPVVISPIDCGTDPSFGFPTAIDACDGTVSFTFTTESVPGNCDQAYTLIRTWIASDDCGNTATCSATIAVEDTSAPAISCPADVTAICELSTDPETTGYATAIDICDPTPIITYVDDLESGFCPIILTRTWTATDDCGNTSTCVQTIEVSDNTPPAITCAVVISPIECGSTPDFGETIVIDDCDASVTVTFVTDSVSGNCGQEYTLTRTWTATDDCGNTATCSSTIAVQDNTAPMITCPIVVSPVECGSTPSFGAATATDACDVFPEITFSDVTLTGECSQEYSLIRTWIATDDCGNSSSCSASISVQDNTAPILICPTVESPIECGSTPDFGTATATDECDSVVDISFTDSTIEGLCSQAFSITRTWTATDDCGNTSTCSATILVEDSVPPTIVCPVVNSPIDCGEIPFFGLATSTDACDGQVGILFSDVTVQGICAQEYSVTRTWTATDDCGNTATCSRTIDVGGIAGLVITCPPALNVSCASLVPAIDITLVEVSGNCGVLTISHLSDVISNQTCMNAFTLTRTYQAIDDCGNVGTCSQIITVLDNLPPVITFVNPLIEFNGDTLETQCYGQDPDWDIPGFEANDIMATDICEGEVTITYNRTIEDEGDCSVNGYINLYRLTWTATDVCGNSSTAFAFLALIDTIPPVLVGVPDNISINCDDVTPPVTVYATDECLCACVVLFQQVDTTQAGCRDGVVIIRTWTAKDRCGNETIAIQRITLIDEAGPELFFTTPELVGMTDGSVVEFTCSQGGMPDYLGSLDAQSVFASSTCGGSFETTFTEEIDVQTNCEFFGYLEQRIYVWTATDLCGNSASLTFTARMVDDEAPVLSGVPAMTCSSDPSLQDIAVSDNCDHVSLRYWDVNIPNPCGVGEARRRTYEATDDCGNMAVDTTIILPEIQAAPFIVFTNPQIDQMDSSIVLSINCDASTGRYTTFGISDVSVEGVCVGGAVVGFSETVLTTGDCADGGFVAVVELRWTATDICGNYTERMLQANIVDESVPVFVNFTPTLFIGCNDSIPTVTATDNCGQVFMTHADRIIPGICVYQYRIERLITATDPCGNSISRQQIIHVGNSAGPVITGVEEEVCDDLTIPIVTAYDECADQFVEVTMHQDTLDITCRDGMVIQRTWTATDACGDITVIHQTIIIHDETPPAIFIPANSIVYRFSDQDQNLVYLSQTDMVTLLNALNHESVQVYDDCDQVIIPVLTTDTLFALNCELEGYAWRITYTWTATDICGNTASVSIAIDVMDDVAPVFANAPTDTMIICGPLPQVPSLVLIDSLEQVSVTFTETIVPGPDAGQFTVTRTWTATDLCGNVMIHIQRITWQPESTLECNIMLPESVQCNSHGVIINSEIFGGSGPYTYEWQVVGENCFIQAGQGTPGIEIYMGWAQVKIILTVTDTFGCVSMCMIFVDCIDEGDLPLVSGSILGSSLIYQEDAVSNPSINTETEMTGEIQKFKLWPNPAKETINLGFESGNEGIVEYSVMDFLGQTLSTKRILAHQGYNVEQIDAALLSSGTYVIVLRSDGAFYTQRIVIIGNE